MNVRKTKDQGNVEKRGFLTPFKQIQGILKQVLPPQEISLLPKKWEKIGDVLILKMPQGLKEKEKIAEIYASILNCRSVLEDAGGITGIKREPTMNLLFGDTDTETIHVENGIYFKLDVSKVMFSSGNIDERIRMASIGGPNEVVVDFFAGIGYFTLPMAVYRNPHIYACELNPVAYHYLLENLKLNNVEGRVKGLFGDCREVAPRGIADRVILGYLDAYNFLPDALQVLKKTGGTIHYHEACPNRFLPNRPLERIQEISQKFQKRATIVHYHKVKSYMPSVSHVVVDAHIW